MKEKSIVPVTKDIILPILTGVLFYGLLVFGRNANIISKNTTVSLIAIGIAAILVYVIVFGILRNKSSISPGFLGLMIGKSLFAIGIPISIITYKVESDDRSPESLLERNKIGFILEPKKTFEIRYGTFVKGKDTIRRFIKDDEDFESIKNKSEKVFRIQWIDSSSYWRIDAENDMLLAVVKIGNFDNGNHQLYTKPVINSKEFPESLEYAHKIEDQP